MRRAVVLEGPDNVGKTTLAKQIQQVFPSYEPLILHSGPPKKDDRLPEALASIRKYRLRIMNADGRLDIWDRSIIGMAVYGPLYRPGLIDYAAYDTALRAMFQEVGRQVLVIVLYTCGEVYRKWKIRPKDDEVVAYQTQAEARRVAGEFVTVVTRLELPYALFVDCERYADWEKRNRMIVRRVQSWLKKEPFQWGWCHKREV